MTRTGKLIRTWKNKSKSHDQRNGQTHYDWAGLVGQGGILPTKSGGN